MKNVPGRVEPKAVPRAAVAIAVASIWLCAPVAAFGQPNGCVLVPDGRNPSEKILRCGDGLAIRAAPNTRYRVNDKDGQKQPAGAQLDSGALMLEFTPSEGQRDFQILTPLAIAAVRGTKWVVEVSSRRTSTLVISGAVEVTRPDGSRSAMLKAGEGADVSAGTGPIVVTRWARRRVEALLGRFGR